MKQKKIYCIAIAILFFGLAITAVPTIAGEFNSVYGYVYINDVIAPPGVEVKLNFTDEEIPDLTDSNGYYIIDFTGHDWEEGYFFVNLGGTWYTPEPSYVDITEETGYENDLYVVITNNPPNAPSNPNPSNGANGVNINKDISWTCTDPDEDPLTFDIYFGTTSEPTLFKSDHSSKSFNQGSMNYETKYYWKIIAKDDKGGLTEGPIWSFTTQAETSGGGGGEPGGGGGGGIINIAPVADASRSETAGIIGIPVDFDGSESYDTDGSIVEYTWNFGDSKTGSGITTTHSYTAEGVYSVTLTVKDNIGAIDSSTFDVSISPVPNTPPNAPEISGPTKGTKGVEYEYSFISIDIDGDYLSYNISWGDDESITTDFSQNTIKASHSWSTAGIYTITANAYDNKTDSGDTKFIVLIDTWWVKNIGYLLDDDANGVYEKFNSNSTGEETNTEQSDDGKYLIDEDGDGDWDWVYDKEDNTLTAYSKGTGEEDYTLWYALILIIIILIIIGYFAGKRKKKPRGKKPEEPKDNPGNKSKKKK